MIRTGRQTKYTTPQFEIFMNFSTLPQFMVYGEPLNLRVAPHSLNQSPQRLQPHRNRHMNITSAFERDLNSLVQSIQQYSPDASLATKLIHDSDQIGQDLAALRQRVESYNKSDTSEEKYDSKLTAGLQDVLHSLVECKKSLDALPKPEFNSKHSSGLSKSKEDTHDADDTRAVLAYALKLSKFSKIPRTFDGMLLPNNFIWPGDDNMRRGNLAMASLIPEKIIQTENYGADYAEKMQAKLSQKHLTENKPLESKEENESDDDEFMPDRSENLGETVNRAPTSAIAGLDLLDSDDE